MMLSRRAFTQLLGLGALHSTLVGCRGLHFSGGDLPGEDKNPLPPIQTSGEAVQLEIVFVERPMNDPLLGHALWQVVDQIGAIEPNVRTKLRSNGLRVGVSPSTPPRALQSLLGLTGETEKLSQVKASRHVRGRRVVLRPQASTEIQTTRVYPECSVKIAEGEQTETATYKNVRCLFRLEAKHLQDGWAKLEFLPEIHHGSQRLRRKATEAGWQLRTAQQMEKLYSLRFGVTINVGEMVVVGLGAEEKATLGRRFFVGAGSDAEFQRLLIVRLADLRHNKAVYKDD